MRNQLAHLIAVFIVGCQDKASSPRDSGAASAPSVPDAASGSSGAPGGSAGTRESGAGTSGGGTTALPEFDAGDCEHAAVVKMCSDGWCTVPAGCFVMGSPPTEPGRGAYNEEQTAVTLTRAFEIGQHEVTQADWVAKGLPNPSGKNPDGTGDCLEPECPVGNVTWYEAAAFANLLSEAHSPSLDPCYELLGCAGALGDGMKCDGAKTNAPSLYECEGYRLPTFAEWEYAARAGTRTAFYGGDIGADAMIGDCSEQAALAPFAWYCANSGGSTRAVGTREPNPWGLYDVLGNAAEWVNEPHFGVSPTGPLVDPWAQLAESPTTRSFRGCAYNAGATTCRVANGSGWGSPSARDQGLGFRLVRTVFE